MIGLIWLVDFSGDRLDGWLFGWLGPGVGFEVWFDFGFIWAVGVLGGRLDCRLVGWLGLVWYLLGGRLDGC